MAEIKSFGAIITNEIKNLTDEQVKKLADEDFEQRQAELKRMIKALPETIKKLRESYPEKLISSSILKKGSKYSFCPYCAERAKRGNPTGWMEDIRPLSLNLYKFLTPNGDGTGFIGYDSWYECPECKRRLEYEDMEKFWFEKREPIKSKFFEIPQRGENMGSKEYAEILRAFL